MLLQLMPITKNINVLVMMFENGKKVQYLSVVLNVDPSTPKLVSFGLFPCNLEHADPTTGAYIVLALLIVLCSCPFLLMVNLEKYNIQYTIKKNIHFSDCLLATGGVGML